MSKNWRACLWNWAILTLLLQGEDSIFSLSHDTKNEVQVFRQKFFLKDVISISLWKETLEWKLWHEKNWKSRKSHRKEREREILAQGLRSSFYAFFPCTLLLQQRRNGKHVNESQVFPAATLSQTNKIIHCISVMEELIRHPCVFKPFCF